MCSNMIETSSLLGKLDMAKLALEGLFATVNLIMRFDMASASRSIYTSGIGTMIKIISTAFEAKPGNAQLNQIIININVGMIF